MKVSVVLPLRTYCPALPATLHALLPAVLDGLVTEVIFSIGTHDAQVAALAEESGARLVTAPPGRGSQLRAGAKAARAPWLFFLHADSRPEAGWWHEVRAALSTPTAENHACYFPLRFNAYGVAPRLVEWGVRLRTLFFALPYGDQGLILSQRLYESLGGFPDWPLMEDVSLVRRLGRKRLKALRSPIHTSAERYERHGYLKQSFSNLLTLLLYGLGKSPHALAATYEKRNSV